MRRKKIKRSSNRNPLLYKLPFILAGLVFLVTGLVYAGSKIVHFLTPEQAVFASPYLRQNQFSEIDKKLDAKGFHVVSKNLSLNKTELTVELENDLKVLFSNEYDIDWQISSLHSIIYKLTIDNKQPKQIDFRFGKPVVKF